LSQQYEFPIRSLSEALLFASHESSIQRVLLMEVRQIVP
jgi:hypothetical protein